MFANSSHNASNKTTGSGEGFGPSLTIDPDPLWEVVLWAVFATWPHGELASPSSVPNLVEANFPGGIDRIDEIGDDNLFSTGAEQSSWKSCRQWPHPYPGA